MREPGSRLVIMRMGMIVTKITEFFEIMMTTMMAKGFGISRHKVVDREEKKLKT